MNRPVHGKAEIGRRHRQKILDHLHKVGVPCEAGALMEATKEKARRTMIGRLQRMVEFDELSRETRLYNGKLTHFFTPLVKTTAPMFGPTENDLQLRERHTGAETPAKRDVFVPRSPGHIRHVCSDTERPYPRQGGQGAVSGFYTSGSLLNQL
jgi:hypothetical protein